MTATEIRRRIAELDAKLAALSDATERLEDMAGAHREQANLPLIRLTTAAVAREFA